MITASRGMITAVGVAADGAAAVGSGATVVVEAGSGVAVDAAAEVGAIGAVAVEGAAALVTVAGAEDA